jgi:Heterokaryon incompatibility protein Het-C
VLVTKAWDDNSVNPKSVADEILQCLFVPHSSLADVVLNYCSFHPDFHDRSSQIQREMLDGMSAWLQSLSHQQSTVLARLSKQAVRDHKNVRLGGEGASHSTSTTSAGSQSGFLQGIPSLAQAQGLYNQVGGGPGGRRGANEPYGSYGPEGTIGSGTGPPAAPVYSRPGGGQADNFYGDARPSLSQPYTSSYPGGPSSDAPPYSPGSHHGRGRGDGPTYGFAPPTQPGFAAPEQSSYLPPGSSYTEPGIPSPYTGGPSNTSGSHYPGSSYPGQSYPGQQGAGILAMPDPGNVNPSYGSPESNFPGTGPGFSSQGGGRFPDPQYDYGSGSGSGYGRGTYQPEY